MCIVYNYAMSYREPIFKLIDQEWDCEWFFGYNTTDIKGMSQNALKRSTFVENKHLIGPLETQKGVSHLMRDNKYDKYILLGNPMVISTWINLIQHKLFYRKKKVFLWSHGWYGREGFVKKWIKRVFFGMADHVFTYGEYAKREAIKQGFNGSKITSIHNSLDFVKQKKIYAQICDFDIYKNYFKNDNPTIIFIGRLTKVKRLDMLLQAIANLNREGFQVNLVLVGNGEEMQHLKKFAKEHNIENNIWFYGACYNDNQNASLIYNADVCVAPGNVGLTAIHTMAFGTPVITHNDFKNQMPEFEAIKEGVTGSFFKYGSIEDMTSAIRNWLSNHKKDRNAIREACVKEIENYWTPAFQINEMKKIINA